jgi:hypothetical protein
MRCSTSGFSHETVSSRPLSISLWLFQIFTIVREDICNFVFIPGINDTGDKLFTGVNDTGEKLSPVSLILAWR